MRAFAEVEQVLPERLRRRGGALNAFTVPMLRGSRAVVDPAVLSEFAGLCRDAERPRPAYLDHDGTAPRRTVETRRPHGRPGPSEPGSGAPGSGRA